MAIHEDAALPVLTAPATVNASASRVVAVGEYIHFASQTYASAASLRECRCGRERKYQDAKRDSRCDASHKILLLEKCGESTGAYLK
jgi:hypothetical protein